MRGLFGTLAGAERKLSSLELFKEIYGGRVSSGGKAVTVEAALEVSTVRACVFRIANGMSQVPFRLYQDVNDSAKKAKEHPLYRLLVRKPNRWQTSFEFRHTLSLHLELTWNAYVFVNRVGIGRKIVELIPIEPGRVTPKQEKDYSLTYKVTGDDGDTQVFGQDAIWHLRGPSWNGWCGMDAISLVRETIGLSATLQANQATFQKNGAQTSGMLAPTSKLSKEQYEFLAGWIDQHLPGGKRYGKPMIVDDAAKYTPFSMSGIDQQLVEQMRFGVEEICRGFDMQPMIVGFADKAPTYASAEQLSQIHVRDCLSPRYQRFQESADINLLSEEELDQGYYTKFIAEGLMRGIMRDQAEYYSRALGSGGGKGWMTQNQVRGLNEMDRSDDPEADKLPQPTNVQPKPQGSQP